MPTTKPPKKVARRRMKAKQVTKTPAAPAALPTGSLADAIRAKAGSAISQAKLAKEIKVSVPSLRRVLAGKGRPNGGTARKYANYLGISVKDLKALVGSATATRAQSRSRRTVATPRAGTPIDSNAALATITQVVTDPLVQRVLRATQAQRKAIASILDAVSL